MEKIRKGPRNETRNKYLKVWRSFPLLKICFLRFKFDKFQMTFDAAFPVWPVPTWFGVWVEPNYTNFLIVETQLRFCKKKCGQRASQFDDDSIFFSRSMFTSNLQFCTSVGSKGIQPGQILMFLNRRQFCQLSDCFCQFFKCYWINSDKN